MLGIPESVHTLLLKHFIKFWKTAGELLSNGRETSRLASSFIPKQQLKLTEKHSQTDNRLRLTRLGKPQGHMPLTRLSSVGSWEPKQMTATVVQNTPSESAQQDSNLLSDGRETSRLASSLVQKQQLRLTERRSQNSQQTKANKVGKAPRAHGPNTPVIPLFEVNLWCQMCFVSILGHFWPFPGHFWLVPDT